MALFLAALVSVRPYYEGGIPEMGKGLRVHLIYGAACTVAVLLTLFVAWSL